MPYLATIAFLIILACLSAALFFMLRGNKGTSSRSKAMARALALRVGASIVLFVCILLAWKLGWIHPTGIPLGH